MCAVINSMQLQYTSDKIVKVTVEVLGDQPHSKTVAWVGEDYLETSENQSR